MYLFFKTTSQYKINSHVLQKKLNIPPKLRHTFDNTRISSMALVGAIQKYILRFAKIKTNNFFINRMIKHDTT